MKISWYFINPGGNNTAIVITEVPSEERVFVAQSIMKENPSLEQVGFRVPPNNTSADTGLVMAGGEFCGNAMRSIGFLLARERNIENVHIESGTTGEIFSVQVRSDNSELFFPIKNIKLNGLVVRLPGISHVISEEKFDMSTARNLISENNLSEEEAVGVMFFENRGDHYNLIPVVNVRLVDTFIMESSCASGTIALGFYLKNMFGLNNISVLQPSGNFLKVSFEKDFLRVGGPICEIKLCESEI